MNDNRCGHRLPDEWDDFSRQNGNGVFLPAVELRHCYFYSQHWLKKSKLSIHRSS